MKKCTLCVDQIYNENLALEDREPACVRTCPTGARHFGKPGNAVSRLVVERTGYDPLPIRIRSQSTNTCGAGDPGAVGGTAARAFGNLCGCRRGSPDRVLAARWLFFAEAEHVVGLHYRPLSGTVRAR